MTTRIVELEACFNFRDLGGYETSHGITTRWGRIYRADALHRLSGNDVESMNELGLSTVIDLRSQDEIEDFGRLSEAVVGVEWHNEPIIESVRLRADEVTELPAGEEALEKPRGQTYFEYLGTGERVASVLTLVADAPGAAVFHCTAGKDRTGIIAALILELVGVDRQTIVEDYVLTRETRERSIAWVRQHEPQLAAFYDRLPPERMIGVDPAAISGFLDRVHDQYGSAASFLLGAGMSDVDLGRLRDKLLAD